MQSYASSALNAHRQSFLDDVAPEKVWGEDNDLQRSVRRPVLDTGLGSLGAAKFGKQGGQDRAEASPAPCHARGDEVVKADLSARLSRLRKRCG